MYFRDMSDWNLAELEDIDWIIFGKSNDHIVPHRDSEWLDKSSARGDMHKKPRHEVQNEVERTCVVEVLQPKLSSGVKCPPKNGSASILEGSQSQTFNIVVPTLSDVERTVKDTALPHQDDRVLDYYVNVFGSDAKSNMFCLEDPSLETSGSINGSKSCISSLKGISPDVTDHTFLESKQEVRDVDLAYYDWPDIDNFEDFDKIFRRDWDSSLGQGQTGSADGLTWFSSSSNTIDGSEIAFGSGFQSSSLDLGALHAQLESCCANGFILPKNLSTTADHDKPTSSYYADCLGTDAPSKGESAGKEESCDGADGINNTGLTQSSNEYSLNPSGASDIKIESQSSLEKGTKCPSDQMLFDSGVLASQLCTQQFSQHNHCTGTSSSYPDNLGPRAHLDFGIPVHQVPVAQIISSVPSTSHMTCNDIVNHPTQCLERFPDQFYMPRIMASEENMEKLNKKEQVCSTIAEHPHQQPAFQNKVSAQKNQLENREDTEMDYLGLELPTIVVDLPFSSTFISSDGLAENVASFQKLQDVMYQLDVRTRLCLRDSLYRLAGSARQRHGFATQDFSEGTSCIKGIQGIEASNRPMDFMDAETNTNPIDRSIAHLLFHKPSESARGWTGDTMSLSLVSW